MGKVGQVWKINLNIKTVRLAKPTLKRKKREREKAQNMGNNLDEQCKRLSDK